MASPYSSPLTAGNTFTSSLWLVLLFVGLAYAQLSPTFYASSCPNALSIIKSTVNSAVSNDRRMGASLLRLHFHDCFVNGCDASILLDDTTNFTGEKSAAPNNNSLRGFDVIDTIKVQLERTCNDIVSCADILGVVARDSVVALGGPSWPVLLGRRDSTTANQNAANNDIPRPDMNLSDLISAFSNKGFSPKEMVALSGAHTIGQVRCALLQNKPNIKCVDDDELKPLDAISPTIFDNVYFKNLQNQMGLLQSDQELFNGGSTDSQVNTYSSNTSTFFADFVSAIVKMGNLSPLTGTNGQIRTNCRKTN